MGGLGPGIGGLEILVIGLLALIVVGPKDLPLMMRKVGQFVARARAMASEFRSSFDEMARQAELDELRKEVDALRNAQSMPLGAEADAAFRDIGTSLKEPLALPPSAPEPEGVSDPAPMPAPVPTDPVTPAKPKAARKAPVKKAPAKSEPAQSAAAKPKAKPRPKVKRTKAVDL